MMNQTNVKDNKDAIVAAFDRLLNEYKSSESKITTKEQEAEKNRNQQLLNKTLDYTVDNIVNSMATLQLSFGSSIDKLADNLTGESDKLAELKKAIAVEKEYLKQIDRVRLVADALHILEREHQEKLTSLQERTAKEKEAIEKEISQTRKYWQKEQEEFVAKAKEAAELLLKQREEEAADYQYELTRQRKIELDEYEERQRIQTRELAEQERVKTQDWAEREKYLADKKKEFAQNKEKITGFEAKIQEEYNKAKGNAIKEADNKYKVEAELVEKEWAANSQGYELKIESLMAVIERHNQQITEINTRLQEVNTQAQNLAMQAFQ